MLLCNFNLNNLFVRYKFGRKYPGDKSGKSEVKSQDFGYLPLYQKGAFEIFNEEQRQLSATVITQNQTKWPDVICVQEVESLIALREFNDRYLQGHYQYAAVIDSRDFRQIDVGILSIYPIESLTSHVDDLAPDGNEYIFNRDCLEARIRISKTKSLTLFVNHFKSKLTLGKTEEERAKEKEKADAKRKLQAQTVVKLVRQRFPASSFGSEHFAVLGDLNDTPASEPLKPLYSKSSGLVNPFNTIPEAARWTHYWKAKNSVSQLDHILLSPALGKSLKSMWIERRGIGFRGEAKADGSILPKKVRFEASENDPNPQMLDFTFERFESVSTANVASDHCAVFLEFKI